MKAPNTLFCAALTAVVMTGTASAGDPARGAEKAQQVCASCHGVDGVSQNPIYPHIGGQYRDYLLHALRAYQSGARQNAIMQGMVAPLSEQDIEDLAAYFASQPGVLHKTPR
jgi:cytochrome c553